MLFAPELPSEGIKIPLQIFDGKLFIEQTQKDNSKLLFLLDTGNSAMVFDPSVPLHLESAHTIGDSSPGSVKNKHSVPIFYVSGFQFAGRQLPKLTATTYSLDNTSVSAGHTVAGVIGQDILQYFLVQLDYPKKMMILKPLPKGTAKDLKWDGCCPTARIKIGEKNFVGLIDSGANFCTVPEAESNLIHSARSGTYKLIDDIRREGKIGTAPITIAGKTFSGLTLGAGTYDMPLIGNELLQYFKVTMDCNNQRVVMVLQDCKNGDKLRELFSEEKWAETAKLIGSEDPEDWRDAQLLHTCYLKLNQFDKAAQLAARQITRYPSEANFWQSVQAQCLHQGKNDDEAEKLLHPLFSAQTSDPYAVVAAVKAISDSPEEGIKVSERLLKKYPKNPVFPQIIEQLTAQLQSNK